MQLSSFDPPGDEDAPGGNLVTIAVAYSLPDAAVMQTTLTAYGIPCYTFGYQTASVKWYWLPLLGGISINVPSSRKDEAIALIPDLAKPRSRAEITAEIKANGGPHARWRLIAAHTLRAGTLALVSVSGFLPVVPVSMSESFFWLPTLVIFGIVHFALLFFGL